MTEQRKPPRILIRLALIVAGAVFLASVLLFASHLFDLIVELAQGRFLWPRAVFLVIVGVLGAASGLALRRIARVLRPYLPKLKYKRRKKSTRRKRRK